MIDLATVTRDTFEAHKGSSFTMHVDKETSIELELVAIEASPTPPGAVRGSFLLRFRSKQRGGAPQQIYRLEHAVLGAMEVFLVPVGPDQIGMRYDAVFG